MPHKDPQRLKEYKRLWEAKPENRAKKKLYVERTKLQRAARTKAYREKNKEVIALKDKIRKGYLSGGTCDICAKDFSILCRDHCHSTGQQRGKLCRRCNFLLGYALDSPSILKSSISYLERWTETNGNNE